MIYLLTTNLSIFTFLMSSMVVYRSNSDHNVVCRDIWFHIKRNLGPFWSLLGPFWQVLRSLKFLIFVNILVAALGLMDWCMIDVRLQVWSSAGYWPGKRCNTCSCQSSLAPFIVFLLSRRVCAVCGQYNAIVIIINHTYSFNRGWHAQPNRKLYIDKEKSHWRWNNVE